MEATTSLVEYLDTENLSFTSSVKQELADLSRFDSGSLDWLMVEHYQFSARNTGFLACAADVARGFEDDAIERELRRNLAEENGHARLYKRALAEIGIDVEEHVDFPPTPHFFEQISELISDDPSRMLGAMYATETAAIFEHEVFREVSKEAIERRGIEWEGARLAYFHDMHLGGVEQSHKDELGIFLKGPPFEGVSKGDQNVVASRAKDGGQRAIVAMRHWWQKLLLQIAAAPALV